MTCPNHHELMKGAAGRYGFNCHWCKKSLSTFAAIYDCRKCNYQLCPICFAKMFKKVSHNTNKSSVMCPNMHNLVVKDMLGYRYRCDKCNALKIHEISHRCNQCNYDLCQSCYSQKARQQPKSQIVWNQSQVINEFEKLQLNQENLKQKYEKLKTQSQDSFNSLKAENKKLNQILMENKHKYESLIREKDAKICQLTDDYKELQQDHNQLRRKFKSLKEKMGKNGGFEIWEYTDVVDWIMQLENDRFQKYRNILLQNMKAEEIDGSCLRDISENDLLRMGIKSFKDRKSIFKHIQKLIGSNKIAIVENEGDGTALHYR
eukprot:192578_1